MSVMPAATVRPPREWGILVKNRRELFNMTQAELADECELAQASIVRIEKGEQSPSLRAMRAIARALRCKHYEDLFPYPDLYAESI